MASTKTFLDVIKARRSRYSLNSNSPIPDSRIVEIVNLVMTHGPSAFNSQTVRTAVLLGPAHKRFWSIAVDIQVDNEKDEARKERMKGRLASFHEAYGTVLFFDDSKKVQDATEKNAAYAQLFPEWTQHSQGMHQLAIWSALDAEGFGANLQHLHHNAKTAEQWHVDFGFPAEWKPYAQLVFGGRADEATPPEKPKLPLAETVKVIST